MIPSLLAEAKCAPEGCEAGSLHRALTTSRESLMLLTRSPDVLKIRIILSAQPGQSMSKLYLYLEAMDAPVMTVSLS